MIIYIKKNKNHIKKVLKTTYNVLWERKTNDNVFIQMP